MTSDDAVGVTGLIGGTNLVKHGGLVSGDPHHRLWKRSMRVARGALPSTTAGVVDKAPVSLTMAEGKPGHLFSEEHSGLVVGLCPKKVDRGISERDRCP